MINTRTTFFSISLVILVSILFTSFKQTTFQDELKQKVNTIDNSWTVTIDTIQKFKHPSLVSGTCVGRMTLTKKGESFHYNIYKQNKDSLKNEIREIHLLASCGLSKNDYKNEVLTFKDHVLFLPVYPCWSNGYSEEAKMLIGKLVKELK